MRKIILIVSAAFATLLLAACGGGQSIAESQVAALNAKVARLEAEQLKLRAKLKEASHLPSGIVAVPAARRSGVYDDTPIREANAQTAQREDDVPTPRDMHAEAVAAQAQGELQQALALYHAGDIDRAVAALQQFLATGHGHRGQQSLAHYWLGDAYYNQRDFQRAGYHLLSYLRAEPYGEKAHAARQKLIYVLRATGHAAEADALSTQSERATVQRSRIIRDAVPAQHDAAPAQSAAAPITRAPVNRSKAQSATEPLTQSPPLRQPQQRTQRRVVVQQGGAALRQQADGDTGNLLSEPSSRALPAPQPAAEKARLKLESTDNDANERQELTRATEQTRRGKHSAIAPMPPSVSRVEKEAVKPRFVRIRQAQKLQSGAGKRAVAKSTVPILAATAPSSASKSVALPPRQVRKIAVMDAEARADAIFKPQIEAAKRAAEAKYQPQFQTSQPAARRSER